MAGGKRSDEIVVFSILKSSTCSACGQELHPKSFLRVEKEKPLCLSCADLDHLVFLPAGDAALTRRSRKKSALTAVVLRFSRARKRYERQGLLVEEAALEEAEQECLDDEDRRMAARERDAIRREREDAQYIQQFVDQILATYPGCPPDEAKAIGRHACQKHSGRIGRTAAAKDFDPSAIDLAVQAHVRHAHSDYGRLLAKGWDRHDARLRVSDRVQQTLRRWSAP